MDNIIRKPVSAFKPCMSADFFAVTYSGPKYALQEGRYRETFRESYRIGFATLEKAVSRRGYEATIFVSQTLGGDELWFERVYKPIYVIDGEQYIFLFRDRATDEYVFTQLDSWIEDPEY